MEHYLFTTYQCNLKCSYCSSRKVAHIKRTMSDSFLNALTQYLRQFGSEENVLVFFGGEPFLGVDSILRVMRATEDFNCRYRVYTNGTLLENVPRDLLSRFEVVYVSLDGDRIAHERHRGKGTYDQILKSIALLRDVGVSKIVGRITVEEDTNLVESVSSLVGIVTDIYWQVVNKPVFTNGKGFAERYANHIDGLLELWVKGLDKRLIINMIPFQAVLSQLLFPDEWHAPKASFRCGAGNGYRSIDLEGNIYWCDEYIGNPAGIIGTITNPILEANSPGHKELFEDCTQCDVEAICLGRCRKCLTEYSDTHKREYCVMTKHMIHQVRERLLHIRSIVDQKRITPSELYPTPHCTEEIP